jgi:hypothetical protein
MNVMGSGTMICARNGRVDITEPHIATEWVTFMFFRLWPLGTYRMQLVEYYGAAGFLVSNYAVLDNLPWKSNKVHIIRSLIVTLLVLGMLLFAFLNGY